MIASYYYDPFGRRLWKEVSGVRTYFHYADEGLIGEYDSAGAEIKTYGYKPGSTWTTDPLFMKEGPSYYFYQNDHLGTPQKMTAVNGAVVWSAKYSSFGEADIDAASTITNNLRFPGQYEDEETGLHYNWFRFYDPSTGRYLTSDLIGLAGGINLFSYVLNNPLNLIDPWGLQESRGNHLDWFSRELSPTGGPPQGVKIPSWDEIMDDMEETGRCAAEYGKCMSKCLGDNHPALIRFKKRNKNCTKSFNDCVSRSGGDPRLVKVCQTLKKGCQAGAVIHTIAFTEKEDYEQVKKCHEKCTSD